MADFMGRPAPMLDQVLYFTRVHQPGAADALGATMTPADQDRLSTSMAQERDSFLKKVPEYLEARKRDLQQLVSDMDVSRGLDSDFESRWKQACDTLQNDTRDKLNALLDGVSTRSVRAVELRAQLISEESIFSTGIAQVNVGARWKKLGNLDRELAAMSTALRVCQPMLVSRADEIDARARDAVNRMCTALKRERDDCGTWWLAALQALQDTTDILNRAASDRSSSESVLDAALAKQNDFSESFTKIATAIRTNTGLSRGGVAELQGYQAMETGALHRLLQDSRRTTAEYMREPAGDRATYLVKETEDLLNAWASNCTAPGQRADADAVREALIKPARDAANALADRYKRFCDENAGFFLGGYDRAEVLLHSRDWEDRWRSMADLDVPGTYNYKISQIDRRLDSGVDTAYEAWLRVSREAARDTLVAAITRHRDNFTSRFSACLNDVRSVSSEAAQLYGGDGFKAVFKRDEVSRSLKQ